jgi:GT2 family glycosyltransferase/glycosyltransferase involved in cell wall biosynthesis
VSGKQRSVVAVLACHGRSAVTRRGLTALLAQKLPTGLALNAVVVDDGSPDDTATMVARDFPQVRLLRGDGSLWWAGAMMRGLAMAAADDPDFLFWLNDDVQLDPDALSRLIACHDDRADGPAVVVGATRSPDDGTLTYGGQRRDTARPFRFHPVPVADKAQDVDSFQGNIVLVPLAIHRQLGGIKRCFDGVQGMADTDFGLRVRAAGFALLQAPGTAGVCAANLRPAPWADHAMSVRQRLAGLFGPRGFPVKGWLPFVRRHGGPLWPVWAISPYLRRLPQVVQPPPVPGAAPRIALMDGLFPPYRLPVLAGLARAPGWQITAFHGPAPTDYQVSVAKGPLPLPVRPVRHLTWPDRRRMAWSGGVWAALTGGYDIAVMEFCVHNLAIWVVWLVRQLTGRPRLVLSGHFRLDRAGPGLGLRVRHGLRMLLARGADALLPYTPGGRDACIARGLPADRIFVTHNTVDVAACRAAAAALDPDRLGILRRDLGLAPGPVLLFVGRLYAGKRVDMALEALDILRDRGISASLLVVGDGPDKARLSALAGTRADVRLLPGESAEERLAPLFALADLLVCPGAVGLVIAHAFAYGLPLVTCKADTHGVEIDYLRPGENGLMTAPDAAALADALAGLLQQPETLARLRLGARRTADGMTIDSVVAANIAAYARVLDDQTKDTPP